MSTTDLDRLEKRVLKTFSQDNKTIGYGLIALAHSFQSIADAIADFIYHLEEKERQKSKKE